MSLSTSKTSVRKLQRVLRAKAEDEPDFRFYSLYDKIYRADVLEVAWHLVRENKGAPGIDGIGAEEVQERGVEEWLEEVATELKEKTYQPDPVRRVHIEKSGGGKRPLGIPTLKDRVVQRAAVLVLAPIFGSDLPDEQFAYRPDRSAKDAVNEAFGHIRGGHTEVVDADLSSYFDTIPHHELMKSVARRVSDGAVLGLIKKWLRMPVGEEDSDGQRRRTTESRDTGRGTPQGAPISPLLANLYMRRFVLAWKQLGLSKQFDARLVVYADDLVILCRGDAARARKAMETLMEKLRLEVNHEKTRVCRLPEESFTFLGYRFGQWPHPKTGEPGLYTRPAKKRVQALCQEISNLTSRTYQNLSAQSLVDRINRTLRGWANYFCLGLFADSYRCIDQHVAFRLYQWWRRKHQSGRRYHSYSYKRLRTELGLLRLQEVRHSFD